MRVKGTWLALLLVLWSLLLAGCTGGTQPAVDLGQVEIGQFRTEQPWVELNGNQPDFAQEECTTEAFETYAPLDALGRCGTACQPLPRAHAHPAPGRDRPGEARRLAHGEV